MSRVLATGGAGRSVAELAMALRLTDIEPIVVCFRRDQDGLEDELRAVGIEVVVLDVDHLPSAVRCLRKVLRERRPDVLHTTLYTADQAGRLAAWGTKVPVLSSLVNPVHEQALLGDPHPPPWRRRVLWWVDGVTARHLTTHFHAITEAVRRAAVEGLRVRPERITVIPRTRDPLRLGEPGADRRIAARRALGVGDAPVLLTVGRQDRQKGQVHLVDAMARVRDDFPGAQLFVAGAEGESTAELRARSAALGLTDHVHLLGHRDDVGDLLAAADVFVLPSRYEGLGAAVLEAMALGLPVVASDLAALREVVDPDRSALLVPAGDAAALAEAIGRVLRDPALAAALGARGRERYLAEFTPDRTLARFVRLYRDVARTGRR